MHRGRPHEDPEKTAVYTATPAMPTPGSPMSSLQDWKRISRPRRPNIAAGQALTGVLGVMCAWEGVSATRVARMYGASPTCPDVCVLSS